MLPAVAAITLGIVGGRAFDKQFGKNQAFNSAGNIFTALVIAYMSYKFGYRSIFGIAALLAIPAVLSVLGIDNRQIDYARARGAKEGDKALKAERLSALLKDRVLLVFLGTAFLFHLSNAAMLPQLGEMLSKGNPKTAAPFMSACIIVTQLVIRVSAAWVGTRAAKKGRKPLLLLGFGVLPLRGILYTLPHATGALIAIQTLDGVANAIFGIVSILVIKDRTEGTGRFNLAAGALATMVGIGAALSTTIGGILIQRINYSASFLGWRQSPWWRSASSGSPSQKLFPRRPRRIHLTKHSSPSQRARFLRNEITAIRAARCQDVRCYRHCVVGAFRRFAYDYANRGELS